MLRVIIGGKDRGPRLRAGARRRRYPARRLHVVDIENLAGAAVPSLGEVREVQDRYAECMGFDAIDHVVVASSHRAFLNTALGWPRARYRVRSGPDGADLELLDVLRHEHVAERFTHVAIGSGDGAFAPAAADLAAAGAWVTVVSRRGSLSARLALAAHEVIFIGAAGPATAAARQLPNQAA